ncbi:TRAFs-binding domain-containing protein [Parerythrobacter aestuarii]|uniref:TRAFs-binding domain-containing protein n=1 Tax=Parerythrobacter aestuarii TaxID=3020909 RepID=UPI0024DEA75C|nr:TRAFs-binding domain-containing protein [Parerythrobacter aestuarii]
MGTAHTQILRLARAGNPVRAWRLFEERGLGETTEDPKVLTLKGRLLKDLARLAVGDERQSRFREASQAYRAAFAIDGDSYPLINAAMLELMAGDIASSQRLARQVLELLESDPEQGENAYWREATRAEALLLLAHHKEAELSLRAGIARLPLAWEDHAATIGQFESILAEQGADNGWLDSCRPPSALHFCGIIGLDEGDPDLADMLAAALDDLKPGFGFGALAAGADILIAEALVARGARLHVTLPGSVEQFRAVSVEPYGAGWGPRFDALLEQAETLDILDAAIDNHDLPLAEAVGMGDLIAMGQTLRHASMFRSRAVALTIVGQGELARPHIEAWTKTAVPLRRIETLRVASPVRSLGEAGEQDLRMHAVVAASAVPASDLARDHGLVPVVGASDVMLADVEAALRLIESQPDGPCAISIGLMSETNIDTALVARTRQMLAAAPAGSIVADRQSAMICQASNPDLRLEELGELSSLSGPVSLWSLSPARPGQ